MNIIEGVVWLTENPDKKLMSVVNNTKYYMWFNHQGYLRRSYVDSVGEVSFTGYTADGDW